MSYAPAAHAQLVANPASMETLFNSMRPQFKIDLGHIDVNSDLSLGMLAYMFAAIMVWDLKPYGTPPPGFDFNSLLNASGLVCNRYVLLTWYFCTMFMPESAGIQVTAIGWNNSPVDNHAQMMVFDPSTNTSALLDPTVGIIARGPTRNSIIQGKPVPGQNIVSFAQYNNYPVSSGAFTAEVFAALNAGQFLPDDELYTVYDIDTYANMPPSSMWLTPQGRLV